MKLQHLSATLAMTGVAQLTMASTTLELPALEVIAPIYPGSQLELPGNEPAERATRTITRFEREWLEQVDRLEDLAELIPASQPGIAQGGLASAINSRGFAVTAPHYNGRPDIQRLFVRDLNTVERVDILSGPDAIMEGLGSPGGAIRYHGKRAEFTPARELGLRLDSGPGVRLSLDDTGPLHENLAYRLTFVAQDDAPPAMASAPSGNTPASPSPGDIVPKGSSTCRTNTSARGAYG